jgi:hypothetical protein
MLLSMMSALPIVAAAYAAPPIATNSARQATAIAGEGRHRENRFTEPPPLSFVSPVLQQGNPG